MKYNNLISVNENFQYSVNLQFDINNISKLDEYIPTKDGCEVLKFYVTSVLKGKNRATTLIGPYGKGKSHLLLVLITLLNSYTPEDTITINTFIKKIKYIDEELYNMLLMIREQKIKLMPIIINSNYNDLNQAFLLALSEALEREKLDQIIINNYFKIALEVIAKWETDYPEMLASAKKCLIYHSLNLKELKQGLKIYSQNHYEIFQKIYSCVLPGQEFNPLVNSDIIKTYKDLTHEIAKFGYHGIYIVFDEFSKFLECVDNSHMMKDLKLLQDFAELAARTKTQEQIHLNCITHKTINEYIKNFTEDKVNAFKTVEGRFKEIYFNRSMEQHYEIVSYAINKQSEFNNFYKKYYLNNKNFYDKIKDLTIFKEVDNIEEILFKGCFPLNPITVYTLVGLSEKIAQNERTLFTFLTDDDNDSLKNFIQITETGLFSIDKIYDYFKPLLKKETDDSIKAIWMKAENALNKLSNQTEKNIVKAIALIYMLNETDIFVPDDNTIILATNSNEEEYQKAVNNLIEKSILKRRKIVNYLDFATIYNRQLTKEIKNLSEEKFANINEKEVLTTINELGYSLPRRYNEEYKMTRFFKNIFMTEEEILNLNSFNLLLEQFYCDGLVVNLLKTSKDSSAIKEKFQQINSNKVVLKIPKKTFSKTISNLLKEYVAIKHLKSTITTADELTNELISMQQEIEEAVIENLKEYFASDNIQEYLYQQETHRRVNTLSSLLSDICVELYNKTPKINNEMINKKELTPAIKKARSIVIDTVLTNDVSYIKSPTSAEATIYKAIVEKKKEPTVSPILEIIKDFIQSSDNNKLSFSILYNKLTKEPYSIRLGLIPILISMALYDYADNIIIYFMNKEIDLDSNNLIKINENPNKYFILTEKGTTDKVKYLANLMTIYNIPNIDTTRVNVKKLIDTMKRWILSLPRILREITIESEGIIVKSEYLQIKSELLKPDINTNEFIYQTLLSIYQTTDYTTVITNMAAMKQTFDNFINEYINHLIIKTKTLINKNFKGSLTTLLKEWYNEIEDDISKKVYDLKTKNFLDYISSFTTHDESDIIEKISKIITGFYIEDWNPLEYNNYINELSKILENIKNADDSVAENQKIVIITENEVVEKNLNLEEELTALGNTMKNNIEEIIDEYGGALTEQEKINVLLNILRKYL